MTTLTVRTSEKVLDKKHFFTNEQPGYVAFYDGIAFLFNFEIRLFPELGSDQQLSVIRPRFCGKYTVGRTFFVANSFFDFGPIFGVGSRAPFRLQAVGGGSAAWTLSP